tara:strand:+ start:337 stop:495 length:159 start_codon:yes stop_codon:yes gene_type:complete
VEEGKKMLWLFDVLLFVFVLFCFLKIENIFIDPNFSLCFVLFFIIFNDYFLF